MKKYSFMNDYSEIAHFEILEAIEDARNEQNYGYGLDEHCENAKKLIKKVFKAQNSDVHFLMGGTQTNMTVISYALKDYEGVLAVESGHINVHETAAVEGSGHKVYTVKGNDGKLCAKDVQDALEYNCNEHMVKIGMVYISQSTEIGTIYTLSEIKSIYEVCKKNNIYLFVDGARLSSALMSTKCDMSPSDLVKYSDVFYIGGTKIGLLFGEAVVINNDKLKNDFRYQIKNKGGMLAKGFILGIQFERIFKNNLYFELGKKENELAQYLQKELKDIGIQLLIESPTNQIFVIMKNSMIKKLYEIYDFEIWNKVDKDHSCVRFVISWFTKKESVDLLLEDIKKLAK